MTMVTNNASKTAPAAMCVSLHHPFLIAHQYASILITPFIVPPSAPDLSHSNTPPNHLSTSPKNIPFKSYLAFSSIGPLKMLTSPTCKLLVLDLNGMLLLHSPFHLRPGGQYHLGPTPCHVMSCLYLPALRAYIFSSCTCA